MPVFLFYISNSVIPISFHFSMIVRYMYHEHINKEILELISKVHELFFKTSHLNEPILLVKIPNLYKYSFDSTFYVLNLLTIHLKRN